MYNVSLTTISYTTNIKNSNHTQQPLKYEGKFLDDFLGRSLRVGLSAISFLPSFQRIKNLKYICELYTKPKQETPKIAKKDAAAIPYASFKQSFGETIK